MIGCYVDESGKSRNSDRFLVCVCIFDNSQKFSDTCSQKETASKKGNRKWHKSSHERRIGFVRSVLEDKTFKGTIFYSQYKPTVNYDEATIQTIAKAIKAARRSKDEKARIYVDGLSKSKVTEYSNEIRLAGVGIRKVRGIQKETSNPLIRLADAIAGFLLDALKQDNEEMSNLLDEANARKTLIEI